MKIILPLATVALLAACAQDRPAPRSYGNDALPSAEVTAYQAVEARLKYRDARIDHDAGGCAVYRGIAPDGTVRQEVLLDPAGKPICVRR